MKIRPTLSSSLALTSPLTTGVESQVPSVGWNAAQGGTPRTALAQGGTSVRQGGVPGTPVPPLALRSARLLLVRLLLYNFYFSVPLLVRAL